MTKWIKFKNDMDTTILEEFKSLRSTNWRGEGGYFINDHQISRKTYDNFNYIIEHFILTVDSLLDITRELNSVFPLIDDDSICDTHINNIITGIDAHSIRLRNCLINHDIDSLNKLNNISEKLLIKKKGIGSKSLIMIRNAINSFYSKQALGLKIKEK